MKKIKYPYLKLSCLLTVLLFVPIARVRAQQEAVQNLITKIDTFNSKMPVEKLFLQMDKPYYAVGDTVWFKAYLCNPSLSFSTLSSRLYVELLNDSGKVIQHISTPMALGISWGNIDLGAVRNGSYTIRAYTNWMRNFGDDYFFQQAFYIGNPQRQKWIVNATSNLNTSGATGTVNMNIKLSRATGEPEVFRQLQLRVLDGKRVIYKGAAQTGSSGEFATGFPLPAGRVKNLTLSIADKTNPDQKVMVPVDVNRLDDIDLQFMPEGGYMVAGLPSHIGFKAIGEDGRGVDVSGKIINTRNNQDVVDFRSTYNGMGAIDLAPQTGDIYVARLVMNGTTRDIPLPEIKSSGTTISVQNSPTRDTMDVRLFISADKLMPGKYYYLVGQSRGAVCFATPVSAGKPYTNLRIPKSGFPTGIVHLTLLGTDYTPLNERLTYVDHKDNLAILMKTDRKSFAPYDSIPVKISVQTAKGEPVVGSFSIAVTDDKRVKIDSSNSDNIISHLLLSSELKGTVENAGHYINNSGIAWKDIDCLLLTQGWIGYDWTAVTKGVSKPMFSPEYQYAVSGKISNLVGKPIPGADVLLLSTGKYKFVKDTTADSDGRFVFKNLKPVDSVTFVLQARNARHKIINSGIQVDEKEEPPVDLHRLQQVAPWYVNSSNQVLNYIKTDSLYHKQQEFAQYGIAGKLLNGVTVRDKAVIKGSYNLNGPGQSDQTIDEEELEKANKTSLTDLLLQKVNGFRVGFAAKSTERNFFIKDKSVHFVIDGVDINKFYEPLDGGPPEQLYNYVKQYLDYFTAEDVRGIEVFYSTKYTYNYNNKNLSSDELQAENPTGGAGLTTASIEITTRSGNGPFTDHATGVLVYKPMMITHAADFYRPRYQNNKASKSGDFRSTIHWQPSIVTSKDGNANVSFYAADKPGTYTVIVEGTDFNGDIGYKVMQLNISK